MYEVTVNVTLSLDIPADTQQEAEWRAEETLKQIFSGVENKIQVVDVKETS